MKKLPQLLQRRYVTRTLIVVSLLLLFAAGFLSGTAFELRSHGLDLSKFWTVYDLVKNQYVGSVNSVDAVNGAAKGLVDSLGDPYSSLLEPTARQELNDELSGAFQGIGAELTVKNNVITVVAPLTGSPAEKAGLKASDIVVKINDLSTEKMSLSDAVSKIRGPKGTTVKLSVLRGGDQTLDITVQRDDIQVKSVVWKMDGSVGYIEIHQFGDDTVNLTKQAVQELLVKKPTALIIDLRNNPGGYLNDVAPITGLFVPPSVIVQEKYRDGKTDQIRSTDVPIAPDLKLFVLTNGGSASAAEIVAGALQDYKRATLVGQKTFGKGSVQDLIPLSDGSALRLTIAEWLTPNNRSINKQGIEPDVKIDGDKTADKDPVLDKALELARAKS